MVSPFLPPQSLKDQGRIPIAALVVQAWPTGWEACKHVAISLSLYESLIIPLCSLRLLLRNYYAWRHPSVPCLFLQADA
jgi:hypothetical protein